MVNIVRTKLFLSGTPTYSFNTPNMRILMFAEANLPGQGTPDKRELVPSCKLSDRPPVPVSKVTQI